MFDGSELIDENWDVQDLPLEDGSVDCYVCNAILEHVPVPELVIYEMHRTLKIGGHIWVEVPFLQYYYANPNDFLRWTLPGVRLWVGGLEEMKSDMIEGVAREAGKFYDFLYADAKEWAPSELRQAVVQYAESLERI